MGKFAESVTAVVEQEAVAQRCIVGRFDEDFDDDDRQAIISLLGQNRVGVIHRLLNGGAGEGAIRLHAKGRCCCPADHLGKGAGRHG